MKGIFRSLFKTSKTGRKARSPVKKKGEKLYAPLMLLKKISYFIVNIGLIPTMKMWEWFRQKKGGDLSNLPNEEELEKSPERMAHEKIQRTSLKKYLWIGGVCICFFGGSTIYLLWHLFIPGGLISNTKMLEHVGRDGERSLEDRQDYKEVLTIDLMKPPSGGRLLSTINPDFFRTSPVFDQPHVFVVVKNVGINSELLDDCFDFDANQITLAMSPYAHELSEQIHDFREAGYTVLLTIPLQGDNEKEDQGPLTLMANQMNFNDERLGCLLKERGNFDGFVLDRGELFFKSKEAVASAQLFLNRLRKLIIVPPDVLNNQWHSLAAQIGLPSISALVENPTENDIESIRHFAKMAGYAVVTFDLLKYDDISAINQWIKNAIEAKLIPASLSKIMKSRDP